MQDAGGAEGAWRKAVRWLTARDRSSREIESRLIAAGFAPPVVGATLQRLAAAGYLDDRRYANQVAEALVRRGYGSGRARAALTAKGVDRHIVESTLAAVFPDERPPAEAVLSQRFGAVPDTPADRARAARFLIRRGFPEDVVLAILG
jgi:regulatory protein